MTRRQTGASKYDLFFHRANQDAREVLHDTLTAFNSGARSVRELCRQSPHWQSQVGCALARLLWLGKIRRVREGYYERIG